MKTVGKIKKIDNTGRITNKQTELNEGKSKGKKNERKNWTCEWKKPKNRNVKVTLKGIKLSQMSKINRKNSYEKVLRRQ